MIATVALSACASSVRIAGSCETLPLREYQHDFVVAFSDQWALLPVGSELDTFLIDSMDLRDAVRACKGD